MTKSWTKLLKSWGATWKKRNKFWKLNLVVAQVGKLRLAKNFKLELLANEYVGGLYLLELKV